MKTMESFQDLETYVASRMGGIADDQEKQLVSDFIDLMDGRPAYGSTGNKWKFFLAELDKVCIWKIHAKAAKREMRYEH